MRRRTRGAFVGVLALMVAAAFHFQEAQAAAHPSDGEWAKILASNGFGDHDKLVLALEVLFAESSGDCNARNATSTARGCWQYKTGTLASDAVALDPVRSTQQAAKDSKQGTDWGMWEAWTSGSYQQQEARAHKAIETGAPGCDATWDAGCLLKLAWNGVVGTASNTPSLDSAGAGDLVMRALLSLPIDKLAPFVMSIVIFAVASVDLWLLHVFEAFWNSLIAGEDTLGGEMRVGGVLALDTTPLFKFWAFLVSLCMGSLAVLLLTIGIVIRWLQGDPHAFKRDMIYVAAGFILMAASFWLATVVLGLANAFTNTINSYVGLELRALPVYQDLGVQKFSAQSLASDWISIFVEAFATAVIVVELVILFIIYMIRAVRIWGLVAIVPLVIVAGFIPQGQPILSWWVKTFLATVLIKPVNALLFGLYLLVGVQAQGIFNAAVLIALLFVMIKVPAELREAIGHEGVSVRQAHEALHALVTYKTVGPAAGYGWRRLRERFA